MACGYGACYGCVVEIDGALERLCVEGPGAVLLLNASGCLDALDRARRRRGQLDAFVTKTVTPEPREGNPPVRIAETDARDAELDRAREPGPRALPRRDAARAARARRAALGLGRRLLGRRLRRDVRAARATSTIELNLSCPNVDEAPESAAEIVAACRAATDLPLYAKLSPAAWDIAEVARAVEAAGADGLSLVNTIRGLALDERLRPTPRARDRRLLGAGAEADRARRRLRLPARRRRCRSSAWAASETGRDALELVACGATHVALGTVLFADPDAPGTGARRARRGARGSRFRRARRRLSCAAHEAVVRLGNWAKRCRLHGAREVVSMRRSWCRPQSQVQAPVRSLDQRMEALKRANDIRVKRAQLKKDLKSGDVSIERDPPRSARVRLDREGLRHADGGAEVRPREGGPAAQPVPDQPVEDGRRPLRPPAPRADWPLQPLAARVFVVTGPSGAGKGTMVQALLERVPRLRLAVSATTRARRPGEVDGVHYWFLTDEEFDRRLAAGDFLEYHVFPWGQRSGTLRSELDRIARRGARAAARARAERLARGEGAACPAR